VATVNEVALLLNPKAEAPADDAARTAAENWIGAASRIGLSVALINPAEISIRSTRRADELLIGGRPLSVRPELPTLLLAHRRYPEIAEAVARRQTRHMNRWNALITGSSKAASERAFARAGIERPETELIGSPEEAARLAEERLGWPLVIKFPEASRGEGVWLARDRDELTAIWSRIGRFALIAQRYIEAGGRDRRLIVLGGRVIAAAERSAPAGEWRANLAQGGSMRPIEPDVSERELAIRAAGAIGLEWSGVDLISGPDGPLVLEANAIPGLVGVSEATGIDVAAEVLRYLVGR
jgi:ribosomal protein S6--L-glutamate ligase